MKTTLALACFLFALILWGCTPVVSVRPLYTEAETAKPYLDKRAEGEWVLANLGEFDEDAPTPKAPCRVTVSESSSREFPYTVEFRCPGSKDDPGGSNSKYDVHLVSIKPNTFFDARFNEADENNKHTSLREIADPGIIPGHLLGQAWIQDDFVRLGPLESSWVEKNWPGEFLTNSGVDQFRRVDVLLNETQDLRDLLSRNAGSPDAFAFAFYLCRAGVDCDARAVEDQLARTPHNPEVLPGGVKFYEKRGNFARAIVLQRHKIELGSGADTDLLELGRLLLLSRDFDAARRTLAAAKGQSAEVSSMKVLTVRSYFLQGDYAGTVQAAKSLELSGNLASADPIILSYFSLCRLGQAKEAESYLKQQVVTFVGPAEEHLLLLEVLDRVTDSWSSKDWSRSTYYYALKKLRDGERNQGRNHLQDLAKMRPKDDLIGLAAQVELERLPSPK